MYDLKIPTEEDLPFFAKSGDLITGVSKLDKCWSFIPARHIALIHSRLVKGMPYNLASPLYKITRKEAAFILQHYKS